MSKTNFGKRTYVKCFLCRGILAPQDAITTTVKGQLENGQKFRSLVVVCWFCTLDVEKPLKGLACLVPQISTELQDSSPDCKKVLQGKNL